MRHSWIWFVSALFFACPIISRAQGEISWRDDSLVQTSVDSIFVETNPVFEESGGFAWAYRILNGLHVTTRPSLLRRSFNRATEGADTLDDLLLDEAELELRRLGVLSDVLLLAGGTALHPHAAARIDTTVRLGPRDLIIWSEDAWSLWLEPYASSAGERAGLILSESNLVGTARSVAVGADLRDPSAEDWRTLIRYGDPAFFGAPIRLLTEVEWSDRFVGIGLAAERPFYSYRSPYSAGIQFRYLDGREEQITGAGFLVDPATDTVEYDINATRLSAWGAGSNREPSRFHAGGAVHFDRTTAPRERAPEAFENSISLFLGLSSISRRFRHVDDYDFGGNRLIPTGGGGRISIGKISPHSGGLDNVAYLGAEVFQGELLGDLYLSGHVEAGTGVRGRETEFTLLRTSGTLGLPLGPGTVAAWFEHSTIWNWPRHVRLPLFDGIQGVRGLGERELLGDNRLVSTIEYRLFPLLDLIFFDLGLTAFYDIGAVWNQGEKLGETRFRSSPGLGLRFGSSDEPESQFLRFDVAWDVTSGSQLEFILSTTGPFDLFQSMEYRPPGPYIP